VRFLTTKLYEMKLLDRVKKSIWEYPSLFKGQDFDASMLRVLNHLFLVIGNGFDWTDEGYLSDKNLPYRQPKFRIKIPKNFFDLQIFEINFTSDPRGTRGTVDGLLKKLKDTFYYVVREPNGVTVYFASTQTKADKLATQFGRHTFSLECGGKREFSFRPYPICEYSAITEIYNGKTSEGKPIEVKEDYLHGAIVVAKAALSYYLDDEAVKSDMFHPNVRIAIDRTRIAERKREGRKAVENLRKIWGYKKGETVERCCNRTWNEHRKKQIAFLNKFLRKFEGR
jgi:hypothetical protein